MTTSFTFKPHVNTPMALFCALMPPFVYSEGGRMRWGAIYSGCALYCLFGISAVQWCDFRDLESSSLVGMIGSAGFVSCTYLTDMLPVGRFVPKRVCGGIGSAYFLMHAAYYMKAQTEKWPEVEEED